MPTDAGTTGDAETILTDGGTSRHAETMLTDAETTGNAEMMPTEAGRTGSAEMMLRDAGTTRNLQSDALVVDVDEPTARRGWTTMNNELNIKYSS